MKAILTMNLFLKCLGLIITAILLSIGSNYFLSKGFNFIPLLIISLIVGYLSKGRDEVLINGGLLGYFFHLSIILLNTKGHNPFGINPIIMLPVIGAIASIICSVLGHFMRAKLVILLLLIAIFGAGLPMWFTFEHNKNNLTIPLIISLLLAFVFSVWTKLKLAMVYFVTTIGVLISIIIKIIIDAYIDPTSHNLFPFEILIDGFYVLCTSLIGAAIGVLIKTYRTKRASE